jgi:hypothetical protein
MASAKLKNFGGLRLAVVWMSPVPRLPWGPRPLKSAQIDQPPARPARE